MPSGICCAPRKRSSSSTCGTFARWRARSPEATPIWPRRPAPPISSPPARSACASLRAVAPTRVELGVFVLGKVLWIATTPSNSLTFLAFFGVLAAFLRKVSRKALLIGAFGVAGLLVCGLSPLGYWLATPLETRFPQLRPLPEHIAGFIVLGGGLRNYETEEVDGLSLNDAGERILALGDLARRYPSAKIVFSGGRDFFDPQGAAEADLVRRHAEMLGVDPSRITVEDRSRSTYENAVYTHELVRPQPGETWLLVTSAWHMPRSVGCFRKAGFPVIPFPVDFRAPGPPYAWRGFYEVARGLRLTDVVTKEWVGLLAYRLMGRTDALLPGPAGSE
ncbi:MAG: YdcF family protein [Hyphomicrobiales bacterium]|nr:YdcF family protein [Hyphomicrobiales bacterium]